jgi:hypothetical protein
MGLWKTHSAIGTKASGLSQTKPSRSCQHDLHTTLHTFAADSLVPSQVSSQVGSRISQVAGIS